MTRTAPDGTVIRDWRDALERAYWHGVLDERDDGASDQRAATFALSVLADDAYAEIWADDPAA